MARDFHGRQIKTGDVVRRVVNIGDEWIVGQVYIVSVTSKQNIAVRTPNGQKATVACRWEIIDISKRRVI